MPNAAIAQASRPLLGANLGWWRDWVFRYCPQTPTLLIFLLAVSPETSSGKPRLSMRKSELRIESTQQRYCAAIPWMLVGSDETLPMGTSFSPFTCRIKTLPLAESST
jgi:hypothetical protein